MACRTSNRELVCSENVACQTPTAILSEDQCGRKNVNRDPVSSDVAVPNVRSIMSERFVRKICQKDMSERYVRKNVQKISQKDMSKDMSERMSKDMSERCQKECQKICQKDMSKDMSERMSKDMSGRYVRR